MVLISELATVFADVTPIPQEEPAAVARIDYPPNFALVYGYWRALLAGQEHTRRGWELSTLCLEANPANYTVWHYRRDCLRGLGIWEKELENELAFAAQLGGDNPKNYQIWYHRRAMLEEGDVSAFYQSELDYIAKVLNVDAKNYHAWSYRQWIVAQVKGWESEVAFARQCIDKDVRNNSAWNQAWFASHQGERDPLPVEKANDELEYAIEQARLDPYNSSPLRYLRALVKEQSGNDGFLQKALNLVNSLQSVVDEFGKGPSATMLSVQADLLELQNTDASRASAKALLTQLLDVDPIRIKYWQLRLGKLQ